MPLFYQQNINATTQLAIWHIKEQEELFDLELKDEPKLMHPTRRLQHTIGRYLIDFLIGKPVQSDIAIAANGKPYFQNLNTQFSISHCSDWAAAIISDGKVGIDIEIVHERIRKVQHKFLHDTETSLMQIESNLTELQKLSFIWAAKEAMYKWFEKTGVDFKKDLYVHALPNVEKGIIKGYVLENNVEHTVYLHYTFFENVVCVTCIAS